LLPRFGGTGPDLVQRRAFAATLPEGQGYSLQRRPRLVNERPEHARGIGLVASEWAGLEERLFGVFATALFSFTKLGEPGRFIAMDAWNAIESLRSKLTFIENVTRNRVPADLFAEFHDRIRPEIERRARERHKVVHGRWGLIDQFPDELI